MDPVFRVWIAEHWIALLALAVAVYAAGVSSFNTYLNWREKRRKLKVKCAWTHIKTKSGAKLSDDLLTVRLKNQGCTLEIVDVVYQVVDGGSYQVDHPDPFVLTPRESYSVLQNAGRLADGMKKAGVSGLVKIRAIVKEKTGRTWTSNPISMNVDREAEQYQTAMRGVRESLAAQIEENDRKRAVDSD